MAKKMILNRARAIPTTEAPSVSREDIAPSSSRTIPASETTEQLRFWMRLLNLFQNLIRPGVDCLSSFILRVKSKTPANYLKKCITTLTKYLVDKVPDRDFMGLRIRNTQNLQDKVVGISLLRRDQLKADVVWSVLGKVIR
jgi:hypothetical protein